MSSTTLTNLAILKVNIDHGRDYLDYLRPFILDILLNEHLDVITDVKVHKAILSKFKLYIPSRSIQIVLKRIVKDDPHVKKVDKVYKITGKLSALININEESTKVKKHIKSVISGLIQFSGTTVAPLHSEERAEKALLDFLSKFNIPFLKAYLRETALPLIKNSHPADIVLVSKYIIHLQKTNYSTFESFMTIAQGHMLANAFTCPDLAQAPETYKNVTFYLDTPLLLPLLDLDSEYNKKSITHLINLLRQHKGKISIFSHSRDELKTVIQASSEYINHPDGRGSIVEEARRNNLTKSDLLLLAQQVDDKLSELQIHIEPTPQYDPKFQIDEEQFNLELDEEILYNNPKAKQYDINSVRSIFVLRSGCKPNTVEKCKAVLVSNNTAFVKVAYNYGRNHEECKQVSSVITSFSLANMAWLKSPLGAWNIPETEILAFSYSALRPSKKLLNKYFIEIEKLKNKNEITERDHQLLRSQPADDELINLTMKDQESLTSETVKDILEKITQEIKKEESEETRKERIKSEEINRKLSEERGKNQENNSRLFWYCSKKAENTSKFITGVIIAFEISLIFISLWFNLSLIFTLVLAVILGFINTFGFTAKTLYKKLKEHFLKQYKEELGLKNNK